MLVKSRKNLSLVVAIIFVLLNGVQSSTSSSVKARKYVVKNHFQGVPKRSDFEIVEHVLPPLKDGEILLKTEWVSVEPYLRAYNPKIPVPYDQFGFQIGIVEESKDSNFIVGSRVLTHMGWRDYSVVNTTKISRDFPPDIVWQIPNLKGLSSSMGIGAVGVPGITAYFGLMEICKPKAGETVVVTSAAGAVGSLAGQIAKIKGCKVIGFAGSDQKVQYVEKELGFDKAINYKTADVRKALLEAAPNGVDCYFDNVGGELSSIIISQMNIEGRVTVCGSISSYNDDPENLPKATILQPSIILKELKIQGFLLTRYVDRLWKAILPLFSWASNGQLNLREHVTVGFDNIYDAFIGMLAGENIGKAIVKI